MEVRTPWKLFYIRRHPEEVPSYGDFDE